MLMFWDALREAAMRRQDKNSNILSPNDCFSAKKNKNGILFRRQEKNIYRKKTYQNSRNIFHLNFATALRCGTAFSMEELRIFCICSTFFVSWTYSNFCIFEYFSNFRKSNQLFGVEPLKYACSPYCQPSTLFVVHGLPLLLLHRLVPHFDWNFWWQFKSFIN